MFPDDRPGARDDFYLPFEDLVLLEPLDTEDGFAASAVSADDCEVFGAVADPQGNRRLWHARRG